MAGCKNTDNTKEETEKPVITLGCESYPPYNYLNEDGVPTGIDVELATEALIVHEKTRRNSVVGESGSGCNI